MPVANADSYETAQGTMLSVSAPGVLANDTDFDGNALSALLINDVVNGVLSLGSDGSFAYTPNAGFTGTDSFSYQADDGLDLSNTASVTITVSGATGNNSPIANGDSYSLDENQSLTVAGPGVLANDTDADGDFLTAVLTNGTSNGSVVLNSDGGFTYAPNTGFSGTDSFTYQADDGLDFSNEATVQLTVTVPNQLPVANTDSYETAQGTLLSVSAPGVLANDTDADGDALSALLVTDVTDGSLTLNADGLSRFCRSYNAWSSA